MQYRCIDAPGSGPCPKPNSRRSQHVAHLAARPKHPQKANTGRGKTIKLNQINQGISGMEVTARTGLSVRFRCRRKQSDSEHKESGPRSRFPGRRHSPWTCSEFARPGPGAHARMCTRASRSRSLQLITVGHATRKYALIVAPSTAFVTCRWARTPRGVARRETPPCIFHGTPRRRCGRTWRVDRDVSA